MFYTKDFSSLPFANTPSTLMHIDLNSCFASIEQQANPLLRGKPVAVAAYTSANGCILAASKEAKTYGIKTGMRVKDGKALYPRLVVLPPDPWKYRIVHLRLRNVLKGYTNEFTPKSIDEFVLQLAGYPCLRKHSMQDIAKEIKYRIKSKVGDWLTVSIGIGPNRFLAKVAAGMQKPDGLVEITHDNFLDHYLKLKLTDLCGIATANAARLQSMGMYTVLDFYNAPVWKLKAAFSSIVGYHWYCRLRGYEVDDVPFGRRTYGNSYSPPSPLTPSQSGPILCKLVEKMSFRLRRAGYQARGVHVALRFRDGHFWHHGRLVHQGLFDSRDIYRHAYKIVAGCPYTTPLANIAVSCFALDTIAVQQLDIFEDKIKKQQLTTAMDAVNKRWGSFVIHAARMAKTQKYIPDRVAFGNVKELEEFTNLPR
jgi:DNA polymerase-4